MFLMRVKMLKLVMPCNSEHNLELSMTIMQSTSSKKEMLTMINSYFGMNSKLMNFETLKKRTMMNLWENIVYHIAN